MKKFIQAVLLIIIAAIAVTVWDGVYILEDDGDIEGYFLLMNEDENFTAIDVLGSMAVGDISQLVDKIKDVNEF